VKKSITAALKANPFFLKTYGEIKKAKNKGLKTPGFKNFELFLNSLHKTGQSAKTLTYPPN
jgi:hypothetical protein